MAAAVERKVLCSKCKKASGTMTCRGCRQDFCYRHVTEHRQELNQQMDEMVVNHDQLKQSITEQEAQPNCHPLIKRVDQWEEESIRKIQQAAKDARGLLLTIVDTDRPKIVSQLADLANELHKARQEEDFAETDLQRWKNKLDQLKSNFDAADIIDFTADGNSTALIPKYVINHGSTECFARIKGPARIEEDGKVLTHDPTIGFVTARCRNKYSLGQHRFSFRIEGNPYNFSCGFFSVNKPIDFIISTPVNNIQRYGSNLPPPIQSINPHIPYLFHQNNFGFQSHVTYDVLIDCTEQTIQFAVGTPGSGGNKTVNIDLTKLPFPWQFFVITGDANDRVCLC